jgi:ABC-type uncharacterized transport system substrate-binding protein
MKKQIRIITLCAMLLALSFAAEAQQAKKIPRIGFLQRRAAPTPANPDPLWDAFLKGLQGLGYIDGNNIKIEHRYAEGRSDRLDALIAEFLQLKVDVIVVPGSAAIRAAREATKTIPIIIVTQSDPVTEKLVDSLARPGGNITGLTRLTSELSGKRLELFKEAVPAISRVAILLGGGELRGNVEDYKAAARNLNVTLLPVNLTGSRSDLEGAFQSAVKAGVKCSCHKPRCGDRKLRQADRGPFDKAPPAFHERG